MAWLLETQRRYKVILRSKSDDVQYQGAKLIRKADGIDDQHYSAFVLDPSGRTPREKRLNQWTQFHACFDKVWQQGGWTLYGDEIFYLTETLRLGTEIETMLTQGRSLGISFAGGIQRPVRVSRFLLTEARHILAFRIEGRDAKEFADATHEMVRGVVQALPEHHFLWFCRPDRLWVGTLDLKEGKLSGAYVH